MHTGYPSVRPRPLRVEPCIPPCPYSPIVFPRRAYADLVSRLQVAEVEAERTRRAAWQDGLRRWRVLRTQHAIRTFVERIKWVRVAGGRWVGRLDRGGRRRKHLGAKLKPAL